MEEVLSSPRPFAGTRIPREKRFNYPQWRKTQTFNSPATNSSQATHQPSPAALLYADSVTSTSSHGTSSSMINAVRMFTSRLDVEPAASTPLAHLTGPGVPGHLFATSATRPPVLEPSVSTLTRRNNWYDYATQQNSHATTSVPSTSTSVPQDTDTRQRTPIPQDLPPPPRPIGEGRRSRPTSLEPRRPIRPSSDYTTNDATTDTSPRPLVRLEAGRSSPARSYTEDGSAKLTSRHRRERDVRENEDRDKNDLPVSPSSNLKCGGSVDGHGKVLKDTYSSEDGTRNISLSPYHAFPFLLSPYLWNTSLSFKYSSPIYHFYSLVFDFGKERKTRRCKQRYADHRVNAHPFFISLTFLFLFYCRATRRYCAKAKN